MQENSEKRREPGKRSCADPVNDLFSPRFFKALGDPTRVAILAYMMKKCLPSTVSELACCTPVDLSVVSRHLATLREARIVSAEKRGREVLYSIRYPELARNLRALADAIEECCPSERPERNNDEIPIHEEN